MGMLFRKTWPLAVGLLATGLIGGLSAAAQQQQLPSYRAPATPLITHDPYFSIWSESDQITGGPTRHWTGVSQELSGFVRIDGKNFRYLGDSDDEVAALKETARQITPTRTLITLQNEQIQLSLCFFTPAFPDDLRIMARPVTYLTWEAKSVDGATHDVTVYLDAAGSLATNTSDEPVNWSRSEINGLHLLRMGTQRQPLLEQYGDNLRINWGYFYLGIPSAEGTSSIAAGNGLDRDRFLSKGTLPAQDDLEQPRQPQSHYPPSPMLSVALPLGSVGTTAVSRHILIAYDDRYSVEYMHQRLLAYWHKEFDSFSDLLQAAEKDYQPLMQRSSKYDAELEHDLTKAGGPEYAAISVLAFRQAIAAHKLVEDASGVPFFMPKENFSNGSISTVDVIYPSSPMFLFLNPKLVEAQMEPVMRYAETAHWKFPFAPHDLGIYPLANGQLYGGGEVSEDDQMPVEESGDMILMLAAMTHIEKDTTFAKRHWPLVTKWAEYLLANGFNPENQLCTDDFAGHLAHNTNLSIKAIEALAGYAQMARQLGDTKQADKYSAAAKSMAGKWVTMAADGDHSRLAFDKPGTWSQKYNLVWDDILDIHLFPKSLAEQEIAYYKTHMNTYGLPLDNRATYTKLDWTIWSATLASTPADFETIVHPIFDYLNKTPSRVPMSDWYDTITAREVSFQARSVVGGVYIKMLADPSLWSKWAQSSTR